MNFIKQNYKWFINSFKDINIKFFLIIIIDLIFYYLFFQAGNFLMRKLQLKAENVDLSSNILNLNQEAAASVLTSVKGFFFFIIFAFLFFILFIVINWTVLKGLIWNLTTNRKLNLKFLKKIFLLNLIWLPSWIILLLLIVFGVTATSSPLFIIIILLLAVYLSNILYPLFMGNNKLGMIKKTFSVGITKIHHFIIPYTVIVILFFIILQIYRLIAANMYINIYITYVLLLIFVAWLRYYFVEIVHDLS